MFKKVNTALLGLALSLGISSVHAEEAKKVDVLLIGGEPLPRDLYERIQPIFDRVRVFNVYGPTEATIWSTSRLLNHGELNIGSPLKNEQVFVLSRYLEPMPVGSVGEICIAGDGLAQG